MQEAVINFAIAFTFVAVVFAFASYVVKVSEKKQNKK